MTSFSLGFLLKIAFLCHLCMARPGPTNDLHTMLKSLRTAPHLPTFPSLSPVLLENCAQDSLCTDGTQHRLGKPFQEGVCNREDCPMCTASLRKGHPGRDGQDAFDYIRREIGGWEPELEGGQERPASKSSVEV